MSASLPKFVVVREAQFYAGFADVLLAAPSAARLAAFKRLVEADAAAYPAAYAAHDLLRRCAYAASCLAPEGVEPSAEVRAWLEELLSAAIQPAASWNFFCGMAYGAVADPWAADAFPRIKARLAAAGKKTENVAAVNDDGDFGDGKLDKSASLFNVFSRLFEPDLVSGETPSAERAAAGLRDIAGVPAGTPLDKIRPSRAVGFFYRAGSTFIEDNAVAVLDGEFSDARRLRRDLGAAGFRVEKKLVADEELEQLVVVGDVGPRWKMKNVSPLMLSVFCGAGADADVGFIAEQDFRAGELEILRRRLADAREKLDELRGGGA